MTVTPQAIGAALAETTLTRHMRGQRGTSDGAGTPSETREQDAQVRGVSLVRCAACKHEISDSEARIAVSGRHDHTCVNPSGLMFRVRCFAYAPGCVGEGEWSDFYSWFKGFCSMMIFLFILGCAVRRSVGIPARKKGE